MYPKVKNGFKSSGTVPDGTYYTNLVDGRWEESVLSQMDSEQKPTDGRLLQTCEVSTIAKKVYGFDFSRKVQYKGAESNQNVYNMYC